jgi:hypothetical protein
MLQSSKEIAGRKTIFSLHSMHLILHYQKNTSSEEILTSSQRQEKDPQLPNISNNCTHSETFYEEEILPLYKYNNLCNILWLFPFRPSPNRPSSELDTMYSVIDTIWQVLCKYSSLSNSRRRIN